MPETEAVMSEEKVFYSKLWTAYVGKRRALLPFLSLIAGFIVGQGIRPGKAKRTNLHLEGYISG